MKKVTNHRIDRRTAVALIATLAVGCQTSSREGDSADESRTKSSRSFPLRLLLTGSEFEADALTQSWGMASTQGLEIDLSLPFREMEKDASLGLVEQLKSSDVAIVPQIAIGTLVKNQAVAPMTDATVEQWESDLGPPLTGTRNSLGRYGEDTIGLPIGGKLFALLSTDFENPPLTWDDYNSWIKTLQGKAAEPLGRGWAASSFLSRCATKEMGKWLFDRGTLTPSIAGEEYAATLQQMKSDAEYYDELLLTPNQIWERLRSGALKGGIGFECPLGQALNESSGEEQETFDIVVADLPIETTVERLWFDPATPVIVISESCRQTQSSKDFIAWIVGDQGSQAIANQVRGVTTTRDSSRATNDTAEVSDRKQQQAEYQRWLSAKLSVSQHAPGLSLPGGESYYRALDRWVVECLTGKSSVAESLKSASKDWDTITDGIGRESQIAAWRRNT